MGELRFELGLIYGRVGGCVDHNMRLEATYHLANGVWLSQVQLRSVEADDFKICACLLSQFVKTLAQCLTQLATGAGD